MSRPEAQGVITAEHYLGNHGLLATKVAGFRVRPEQRALAKAVETALVHQHTLFAEAGTGVGKTFAYLVPLILSRKKAIISTASRTLQDQLFTRDIPRLVSALQIPVRVVRLKGRSNYVCPYRLETSEKDARFSSPQDWKIFREVKRFADTSLDGDLAGCAALSEESGVWPWVSSTAENCLGSSCPRIQDCFVAKARDAAWEADIVVVNHHLFCADLSLRHDGQRSLLPFTDMVVIDEAHAFPSVATQAFSQSVSTGQVLQWARDCLAGGLRHAADGAAWTELLNQIEQSTAKFRAFYADAPLGRSPWTLGHGNGNALKENLLGWRSGLLPLVAALGANQGRHAEIDRLLDRGNLILERLGLFLHSGRGPEAAANSEDKQSVCWSEKTKNQMTLHWSALDLEPALSPVFSEPGRGWVFLSATLASEAMQNGSTSSNAFEYFSQRIGLKPDQSVILGSPFQFKEQTRLIVPDALTDPKAPDLIEKILQLPEMPALFQAVPGGILILCTSLRAVRLAAEFLRRESATYLSGRSLLVQGESSRDALLHAFRSASHHVLIGSSSFWEGIDVPGPALSMVLIDKLPFAPPDDPVLQARLTRARDAKEDPFMTIQCPEAFLMLKQGVGRLIRSETDRGILIVGDRRIVQTGYGRKMLKGLPDFTVAHSLRDGIEFFKQTPLEP